ncbi:hypothetical protein I7I53_07923 [Histoplasma capsulatum var. duboisii H88]|uniref:Uncharacterized protein n=1 Tax=Ajellomyces capsulatus (strain H88) TaxID=544711 RepID=A0A8A1LEP9_AJEC8|nr:hypothetical protein I7I53_07923 [Histoplasma capsulatum var. duboisii H88]
MAIHGGAIVWSLRDHRRQWQESAQMAAWIRSEPDQPTQDGRYRRLMISQDRHEIFLIIAEYGDNYINYITVGDPTKSPLLTMWQIGPFQPTAMNHIRLLGACLQAFASRLLTLAS